MRFVSNRSFPLIQRSVIPSVWRGNGADQLKIVVVLSHLWQYKTSILFGKSCHSLRSCCLITAMIWMTIERSCDIWPTGSFVKTLIDRQSIIAWLNMPRHVHWRWKGGHDAYSGTGHY